MRISKAQMSWMGWAGFFACLLALSLSGCATTGSTLPAAQTATVTYEMVGLGLNTVKAFIKGQEVSGQLTGAALDERVNQFNTAQKFYVGAGDAIIASITAKDPATQAQKMQAYNDLLQKAALELGKLQAWKGGK
jgi:hypothetical protein